MNRYYVRLETGDATTGQERPLLGVTTRHDAQRYAFNALRDHARGTRASVLRVRSSRGRPISGERELVATVWIGPNGGQNIARGEQGS